jgi:hypothetical protein
MSLTNSPSSLLITCPYHLNHASLTFSAMSTTPDIFWSLHSIISLTSSPSSLLITCPYHLSLAESTTSHILISSFHNLKVKLSLKALQQRVDKHESIFYRFKAQAGVGHVFIWLEKNQRSHANAGRRFYLFNQTYFWFAVRNLSVNVRLGRCEHVWSNSSSTWHVYVIYWSSYDSKYNLSIRDVASEARFRRRTLHVPNLIVLDATQERQWFKRRTKYNVIDKVGAHSPAKPQ